MKFKEFMEYNKEGILIGAIVGAILYYVNPSFLIKYLPDLWWHKLAILVLISSTIGAIIDYLHNPRR